MNTTFARRLGVLTAGALAAGTLSLAATGSAYAAGPAAADPAPARVGADWMATKLVSGAFLPASSTNYGLAIDAALAFDELDQHRGDIAAISTSVGAHLADYWDFTASYDGDGDGVAEAHYNRAAGAIAKTLVLAQTARVSPTAFGTPQTNLVQTLEGRISGTGRLTDIATSDGAPDPFGECANVLGQAFAVRGLATAGSSTKASLATTYLLSQQKADGSFELGLDGSQCGYEAVPNNDATATVVLELIGLRGDPAVKAATDKAAAYLISQQASNGSFIDSTDTYASGTNANSTGLAGWALGEVGLDSAAAKAAAWLRAHQLANAGSCAPYAASDNGAITSNDTAFASASIGALSAGATAGAVRATAQALPALQWAPGGARAGDTKVSVEEFAKAGTATAPITLDGAPGNVVCVTAGGAATRVVLGAAGTATVPLALPATKGTATLSTVDAGGETDTATVTVLAKKKLKLAVADRTVRRGSTLALKVKGLAPGEQVTIKVRGKKVVKRANAQGAKILRVKVTGKPGVAKVVVKGAFGNRRNVTTVRVLP